MFILFFLLTVELDSSSNLWLDVNSNLIPEDSVTRKLLSCPFCRCSTSWELMGHKEILLTQKKYQDFGSVYCINIISFKYETRYHCTLQSLKCRDSQQENCWCVKTQWSFSQGGLGQTAQVSGYQAGSPGSNLRGDGVGHREAFLSVKLVIFVAGQSWPTMPCRLSIWKPASQPATHKQGEINRVKKPVNFLWRVAGWLCWNWNCFH